MRRPIFLVVLIVGSLAVACGAIIGIEDTHDETTTIGSEGGPGPIIDDASSDAGEDALETREEEDETTLVDLDGAAPGSDASPDAVAPPACDLTKPFGALQSLNINTSAYETGARFSPDELTLWFQRRSGVNSLDGDIYMTTRPDKQTPFAAPAKITQLSSSSAEGGPTVRGDLLMAYLASFRSGGSGDLFRATRATASATWGAPARMASISTTYADDDPFMLEDGRALYWDSLRGGNGNIYRASLDSAGNPGSAVSVPGINTTAKESEPAVTLDELTIYFARVVGSKQIHVAKRATAAAPWGTAVPVDELNSAQDEYPDWVSADGCHILISSQRSGGKGLSDVYFAAKP